MQEMGIQTGVDAIAEGTLILLTELRDALVRNRGGDAKGLPAERMLGARLNEAYLGSWLTDMLARALLHKARRAGEVGPEEFANLSLIRGPTGAISDLDGKGALPDLEPPLHRIFERSVTSCRHLDKLDSAAGLAAPVVAPPSWMNPSRNISSFLEPCGSPDT